MKADGRNPAKRVWCRLSVHRNKSLKVANGQVGIRIVQWRASRGLLQGRLSAARMGRTTSALY